MKLTSILLEMRKNPHINKKRTFFEEMRDISKQHDTSKLFVSFMDINKKGINPGSVYKTPVGLYCYQFDYVYGRVSKNVTSYSARPFPVDAVKYIKVFKLTKDEKVFKVTDQLSPNQKSILQSTFENKDLPDINTFKQLMQLFHEDLKFLKNTQKTILLSKLGIDAIIDDGYGVIHRHEPNQVLFINSTILTTIDVLQEDSIQRIFNSDIHEFDIEQIAGLMKLLRNSSDMNRVISKVLKWVEFHNNEFDLKKRCMLISQVIRLYHKYGSPLLQSLLSVIVVEGDYSEYILDDECKNIIVYDSFLSTLFRTKHVEIYNTNKLKIGKDRGIRYCQQELIYFYNCLSKKLISKETYISILDNISDVVNHTHINDSYQGVYEFNEICNYIMSIYNDTKFAHDSYKQIVDPILMLPSHMLEEMDSKLKEFIHVTFGLT